MGTQPLRDAAAPIYDDLRDTPVAALAERIQNLPLLPSKAASPTDAAAALDSTNG